MEMLNQPISSTPHQYSTETVRSYVQQQRQQQSQMSGSYQRPSNGSNILEQHAMRPATTADPSNCVFNDQEASINGILESDSNQMQQSNMMGMQQHQQPKNVVQQNQMIPSGLLSTGASSRLPPLTLNNRNTGGYAVNSSVQNCQNEQNGQNSLQNVVQVDTTQQQMSQCAYDQTTICQTKRSTMTVKEQLFAQQSMNSQQQQQQQMNNPPRMNTPVVSHQHLAQQNVQSQHHAQFQNQNQQGSNQGHQSGVMQQKMNNHHSMGQSQVQIGNRPMSSYQINQPCDQQVPHLSHMETPPTQHSLNSVSQSQMQQHSNQMNLTSTQMGVQSQVQSPTDLSSASSTSSPARLPSLTFGNSTSQMISQTNIPVNANTTTQLIMALNNDSQITPDQLREIQNTTSVKQDGPQILMMQEPRLKQYTSLKDMSTNDLRIECKKRQLSSTGTKVRLSERLAEFENVVLDEKNTQLHEEYTNRRQLYEAQAATVKALQARKASVEVQSTQNQNFGSQAVSSNEVLSTTQSMSNPSQPVERPPAKRKRPSKSKKAQQQEKLTEELNTANISHQVSNNESVMNIITPSPLVQGNVGNQDNQGKQNSSSNMFGNLDTSGSGFFMKDNTCFSHLGSGCSLISTGTSEDNQQIASYGSSGRAFQNAAPPPPGDSQMQFHQSDQQNFQMSQQRNETHFRPMTLNQQQPIVNNPMPNGPQMNQSMSQMFNAPNTMHPYQQPQQNYTNNMPGLQGSPCVADQAGPSPNMPVSDPTATTSASPSLREAVDAAELMDLETMQKLLSPATLRAREELLTQQQSRINELVQLIQKNHDTLREQQMQIDLAKKQQKLRQRQNAQAANNAVDKHVNSRCIQHVIKSRQNFQMLSELTKQQDSIRTAETRLIEQLHINTATDDIARLIKQDGRTALVIVSLLHEYRTKRENNNGGNETGESLVADKNAEVGKKKGPSRKRNNTGAKVVSQNKKSAPQRPEIEVVQVIQGNHNTIKQNKPPPQHQIHQEPQQKLHQPQQLPQPQLPQQQLPQPQQPKPQPEQITEFPPPQVPMKKSVERSQSDVDMEAIFKTVIDASRNSRGPKQTEIPPKQHQQFDNELISLPSEGSSPSHAQSQNSVQSGYSDSYSTRNVTFHQDSSPQHMSYSTGNASCSPDNVQSTPNEMIQQHVQMVLSKQPDGSDSLPQFEHSAIEQDQYPMMYSDDSNQGYMDTNNQRNMLDFDFPDIDQMVANIKETDALSCPLDDIDLTAILNSWTDNCDSKQDSNCVEQSFEQEVNMCDNMFFDQNGSMDPLAHMHDELDWNDYNTQNNIINQAFEQSQLQ